MSQLRLMRSVLDSSTPLSPRPPSATDGLSTAVPLPVLCDVARRMLSEEPVRCAVTIAQVHTLAVAL